MSLRALLLDFDGVISDTENLHIAAWQRTFSAMGWDVSEEVCARAMEADDRAFLDEIFRARGISDGDVEGWTRRKQELTLSLLKESPRVYPGVVALIERIKEMGSVKLAVVTTTWRANVTTVLKAMDQYPAFSLIVAKEDVSLPKPDPEAYTLCVKSLRVSPEDAVALEDSAAGLESARAAGVRAVAVGHRLAMGPWVGNASYLPDLRQTEKVLGALGPFA
ncbi:MAG: HAD family phosphatase [Isosphaeraceae bacterium]